MPTHHLVRDEDGRRVRGEAEERGVLVKDEQLSRVAQLLVRPEAAERLEGLEAREDGGVAQLARGVDGKPKKRQFAQSTPRPLSPMLEVSSGANGSPERRHRQFG